jgi:Transposase DDE domain group 1
MRSFLHTLDRVSVDFDDERLVAHAGLIAPATLAQHLRLREMFDTHIDLGDAAGRANVGHKAMTVIHAVLAGGDSIDDCDVLRAASTESVLGHVVLAPSTIGIFLRSFTWGHARQLDKVAGELLVRAWGAGAGPGAGPVTIDVDSSIVETYGLKKQGGSRFTYTHVRGYHPLVATMASTSDVIHSRLRGGNANTARGAASFLAETFARARTAGATGQLRLRADAGFYSRNVVDACRKANVRFSITVKLSPGMHAVISAIGEQDWSPIPYFLDDGADVAECSWRAFGKGKKGITCRLIVRRTRPTPGSQLALLVDYAYHAFITDETDTKIDLDVDHRRHAVVENAIRDLKYGVGLNHLPSGHFGANAAWLALNVIAHNMSRFTVRIGGLDTPTNAIAATADSDTTDADTTDADTTATQTAVTETARSTPKTARKSFVATDTLRRHHLSMPGRLTRSARREHLHLPRDWPWADQFNHMLASLRSVKLAT